MSELELISQRLDAIQKNQEMILVRLNDITEAIQGVNPKDYIDSLEVMKILNRSASTIYRRRKKGVLIPRLIGGNSLYYAPDIYKLKDSFLK